MSNLNQLLSGLFLYLSVIIPFALYNKYSELMVALKLFFFLLFFLISRKKLLLKYFIIGLFILIMASISSLISKYEFSITRFIIYLIIISVFSFRLEYFKNFFFFKRLYIISVFSLSVVSILNPEIINFFYGWNSYDQQIIFLEQKKYTSIFGLPATASLCYGLILFTLLNSQNLFKKKILFILVPFFLFLLISLKSTSSIVTIFFLFSYYFFFSIKKVNLVSSILLVCLFIIFIILFYFFFGLENFYDQFKYTLVLSFVNRFYEDYFLYGFNFLDIYLGLGFVTSSITFGDVGYFDQLIRLGLLGSILYYFLYYNFLKRLFFNQSYFILIFYIFFLELGHNYSKSIIFLPIILIILFNPTNKYLNK